MCHDYATFALFCGPLLNRKMYLAPNMLIVMLSLCATTNATQVGVTHTQHSLDPWNDDEAICAIWFSDMYV